MAQAESYSLLAELRGKSIVLPDLIKVFSGWPKHVNHNLDRLRRDVDEWLDRYNSHSFADSFRFSKSLSNV